MKSPFIISDDYMRKYSHEYTEPITIENFEEYSFCIAYAVHFNNDKDEFVVDKKKFQVYETSTGFAINFNDYKEKQLAIQEAKKVLAKKGKKLLNNKIELAKRLTQ